MVQRVLISLTIKLCFSTLRAKIIRQKFLAPKPWRQMVTAPKTLGDKLSAPKRELQRVSPLISAGAKTSAPNRHGAKTSTPKLRRQNDSARTTKIINKSQNRPYRKAFLLLKNLFIFYAFLNVFM